MTLASIPNIIPTLPELFLALIIMALMMLGVFHKTGGKEDVKASRLISLLSVISLLLAILLVSTLSGGRLMTFSGMFVSDTFAVYCKVLVLIGSALAIVLSFRFQERHDMARFEYAILIVFATLGMMMMISANDLISLYVGLELQSLSLYVIAAFQRDDTRSTEAGLKYFVLGAVASGMLLYGASLIYGFTGVTNFDQLAKVFQDGHTAGVGVVFGIVFILAGLAFKVSAVPFHMWTPDVYEGAPTPVTAFFAIAPKVAALALFMRALIVPFIAVSADWQQIIVFISILSMLLGAFAAIWQDNIKRLMAYSSIAHMGFALVGLASGTAAGVQAMLIYMAIYVTMNVGTFAFILSMERDGRPVTDIQSLNMFSKKEPLKALALLVLMFSLAGVPPMLGFFGKFYVLKAAVDAGMVWLAIAGAVASVIGAFYYLRIVFYIYFGKDGEPADSNMAPVQWVMMVGVAVIMVLGIVNLFGIEPVAALAAEALVR